MKIIFNRQQILSAVSPLMIAASSKSTLSACDGILIDANAEIPATLEEAIAALSDAQLTDWNYVKGEGKVIVGYTEFAPIAFVE